MAETADEIVGEVGVVVVVYGPDDLVGVPGGADLAVRVAGIEQAEELVASGLVESFVGHCEQATATVERVGLATPVFNMQVIHQRTTRIGKPGTVEMEKAFVPQLYYYYY